MEQDRPTSIQLIDALTVQVDKLRAELNRLSSDFKTHVKHRLCYKCAAQAQLTATNYRIVETRQGRLFNVEEEVDGTWRVLTRRTTRPTAEKALEETKALRYSRIERTLRLSRNCNDSNHGL